jgi:predicted acylesterase/phospholipase RssA
MPKNYSKSMGKSLFRIKSILDLDFTERLLRQGQKRLAVEAIARSASRLPIGVTSFPDGQGLWLDAQGPALDPITALKASAAIPGLYDAPIYPLLGRRCIDGAIAFPFPLREVVARFQPTHVVVIANSPLHRVSAGPPCEESLFLRTQRQVPDRLRHLMRNRSTIGVIDSAG